MALAMPCFDAYEWIKNCRGGSLELGPLYQGAQDRTGQRRNVPIFLHMNNASQKVGPVDPGCSADEVPKRNKNLHGFAASPAHR